MPADAPSPEIRLLLELIDRAYDRKSWHGPTLRGSVRGLTPDLALWRPQPARHNIVEQALHASYWKYAARRRLTGEKRGSFALKGSNWFPVSGPLTDAAWSDHVGLLDSEHKALRNAVASFPPARLDAPLGDGKYTCLGLILGIASHDLYHAGQIQLLKRLHDSA
jgi:DinB superfamily